MATADPMSPEASPGGSTSQSRLITGVRRVNNWPIYIIGALVVVFLLVVVMVVIDRSKVQTVKTDDLQQPKQGPDSMDMARRVAGTQDGGEVPAANGVPAVPKNPVMVPGPVALDANGIPIAPVNPDAPPVPPGGSAGNYTPPPVSPEVQSRRQRIEAMRAAKDQMFTDAVRAPTNIKMAAARSAGSPGGGNENGDTAQRLEALRQQIAAAATQGNGPSSADIQTLASLQGQMAANGGGANATGQQQGRDLGQFGNKQGGDRWQLDSQPAAPRTRYQLTAGFVIPGTLISGINSELPGQIVAQVSQNVYDSATGKYLLIPQGARLVGSYSADVQYGQSRVLVAWQRIVFPDGKAMDIGAMPGSDSAGYGGFKDKVNNHYLRIFGSALFMSAVTAGATLSQPQSNFDTNGNQRQSAGSALSEALGQQLGQATALMIQKNLNISPTLMIRPGFRFNVVVTKDLAFSKPYRSFDY
ncbi:TrbI/VirB10 family protein [Sphingomonas oryzagri]